MADLEGAGVEVSREAVVGEGEGEQGEGSRELETGNAQTRKSGFAFDSRA